MGVATVDEHKSLSIHVARVVVCKRDADVYLLSAHSLPQTPLTQRVPCLPIEAAQPPHVWTSSSAAHASMQAPCKPTCISLLSPLSLRRVVCIASVGQQAVSPSGCLRFRPHESSRLCACTEYVVVSPDRPSPKIIVHNHCICLACLECHCHDPHGSHGYGGYA